jgi:hypothetical protein
MGYGFPEPGSKWYMGGTDGSGEYMVVAEGEFGRVGYREVKPKIYRVRFEPNTDETSTMEQIQKVLHNWCPPQSSIGGDTFRFSVLANGIDSLRMGLDQAIKAMGSFGSFNPAAPEFARKLIDEPFDASATPPLPPPPGGGSGWWIGKGFAPMETKGIFAEWMSKKMSPGTDLHDNGYHSEDEHEDEDEEENEESDDESEEISPTPPSEVDPISEHFDITLLLDGDKFLDGHMPIAAGVKDARLTAKLKEICREISAEMGKSWMGGCGCGACVKINNQALEKYKELLEAEIIAKTPPLTEEQKKAKTVEHTVEVMKAAGDLAACLKAFGF